MINLKKNKNTVKLSKNSYEKRRARAGFLFVLPWLIGFLLFFLYPLIQSLYFSFCTIQPIGFKTTFVGIKNYYEALRVDPNFLQHLVTTLQSIIYDVPIILVFSLFMALILNKKFPGRGLVRAIFFLPVIVTSGIIMQQLGMEASGYASTMSGGSIGNLVNINFSSFIEFFTQLGLGTKITEFLVIIINRIFETIWKSGIQILLFLAGIQAIPTSLYEASDVEGATKWESFWLITFPMVSPIILVVMIYTIIDSFSSAGNLVMQDITVATNKSMQFGYGAAISWIYFVCVFILIGIVYLISSRLMHHTGSRD